ncbi:MAG: J domain-containing protein [Acetobacteraceae bacterium]|nr:J domain-containing protein [Acetobacteraceae bacterium]
MPREAAEAVLRRYGLDAAGLAPEELKRRWQELARRHHPDLGGDMRAMQEINAAYAFLKPRAAASFPLSGTRDTSSPRVRGFPAWVWAGYGGDGVVPDEVILREDYSDRNFLKKRLWELSRGCTEEWTLWASDGLELLPPVVTYGSGAVFAEMVTAMLRHGRRGFRSSRAVLAQAPDERYEVLVLHSDGRAHAPPAALSLSSPEGLARDRAFVLGLPERLDALAAAAGRR